MQNGWTAATRTTKVKGWSEFHGIGDLKNIGIDAGGSIRCFYDNESETIYVKSIDTDGEHWVDPS